MKRLLRYQRGTGEKNQLERGGVVMVRPIEGDEGRASDGRCNETVFFGGSPGKREGRATDC